MEGVRQGPRYALVVRLPREVEVRIEDAFLGLLSTSKPTIGYHITLLGPFLLLVDDLDACVARIVQVCYHTRPFSVRVGGLGAFKESDDNAVFLDVLENDRVVRLHRRLVRATQEDIRPQYAWSRGPGPQPFRPHITLGLGLTDRELQTFLRTSDDGAVDEAFGICELSLVEQRPGEPWHYVNAFPLAAQVGGPAEGGKTA